MTVKTIQPKEKTMLYAEDFRGIARNSLSGKWGLAVGTGLIAALLGADITSLTHNWTYTFEKTYERVTGDRYNSGSGVLRHSVVNFLGGFEHSDIGLFIGQLLMTIIFLLGILMLVDIIIGGAVTSGYAKFNLELVDRRNARFHHIFSQFDRIGAGFCMQFLRALYTFLWTLLLVIPGIIAVYRYSMTPYIMLEHPEYGANEAIRYSKELMRGNKWRLFCLQFSFIGWALLSLLTLGIGFLWLTPYVEASNAAFYREITGRNV